MHYLPGRHAWHAKLSRDSIQLLSRKARAAPASFSRSQRPTCTCVSQSTMPHQPASLDLRGLLVDAFLRKDALELFGSGYILSVAHECLAGKAQSAQSLRALGRP